MGNIVYSDGVNYFPAAKKAGCKHIPYVTGGGKNAFIKLNLYGLINMKTALHGCCNSINYKHLPRYFSELYGNQEKYC